MGVHITVKVPNEPDRVVDRTDGVDGIVHFGTDPVHSCYPISADAEREGVRFHHCTLLYAGASYRLDFDRGANVFVNGGKVPVRQLYNPFKDGDTASLRLGQPADWKDSRNPTFILKRTNSDLGNRRTNAPRKPAPSGRSSDTIDALDQNILSLLWLRRYVLAGLAAIALLFFWYGVPLYKDANIVSRVSAFEQSVGLIGIAYRAEAPDNTERFVPTGTAWLCCGGDPQAQPWLITNAHVADQLATRLAYYGAQSPTARVEARFLDNSGAPYFTVPLAPEAVSGHSASLHPLYAPFETFSADFNQGQKTANLYDVSAYAIPAERIAGRPRLKLAASHNIAEKGDVVATIGFPLENLPLAVNNDEPVAKTFRSEVVRRTDPFLRRAPASTEENAITLPDLLTVEAESAGGLSGSPIFNTSGQVVGMVKAASFSTAQAAQYQLGAPRETSSDLVFGLSVHAIHDTIQHLNGSYPLNDTGKRMARTVWKARIGEVKTLNLMQSIEAFEEDTRLSCETEHGTVQKHTVKLESPAAHPGRATPSQPLSISYEANQRLMLFVQTIDAPQAILFLSATSATQLGAATAPPPGDGVGSATTVKRISPRPGTLQVTVEGPTGQTAEIFSLSQSCRLPGARP